MLQIVRLSRKCYIVQGVSWTASWMQINLKINTERYSYQRVYAAAKLEWIGQLASQQKLLIQLEEFEAESGMQLFGVFMNFGGLWKVLAKN